jgi:hypothetical protein
MLQSLEHPSTTYLSLRWERSGVDIAVTPTGISEVTIDGSDEQETLVEWQESPPTAPWVTDEWNPVPTVGKLATVGYTEVIVARMATLIALGVRSPERTEWFAISASRNAPAATLLSRQMGLGDADEVTIFTDPNKIELSSVSNATAASLRVVPRGQVTTGPWSQEDSTRDALAVWAPNDAVASPELRVLPQELRFALQKVVQPVPRSRLDIGALVAETVTLAGGQQWRYEVALAPGHTDARRTDQVTRQTLDWGGIDREGHFGSAAFPCGYCEQLCCSACVDGIVVCDCCGILICKRCVREPFSGTLLCHACSSTRPATRQEARSHGRLLFSRGMLIGFDPLHTVVVEHSKSRWELHAPNGEKRFVANPSVTRLLDQRLAEAAN